MKGYIKLHRDIVDHWLWLDPKHLKAWLYLLCKAAWEPRTIPFNKDEKVTIGRGQILTTIRQLMGQWGYYAQATLDFLNVLEKEGMITRESYAKFSIITIVNYDKYQDENEKSERKSEQQSKQKSEHIIEHNSEHTKEIKNKEKNNSLSKEADEKFFDELFKQQLFFENTSMTLHIEVDQVKKFLEQFKSEMLTQEKYHKNFDDLRWHFFNWLKKILQSQKTIKENGTNERKQDKARDRHAARRGTPAGSHSPDDYGGSF